MEVDELRFNIDVLKGLKNVARIEGITDLDPAHLTVKELEQLPELESFLEKLTGLRFHISSREVVKK